MSVAFGQPGPVDTRNDYFSTFSDTPHDYFASTWPEGRRTTELETLSRVCQLVSVLVRKFFDYVTMTITSFLVKRLDFGRWEEFTDDGGCRKTSSNSSSGHMTQACPLAHP